METIRGIRDIFKRLKHRKTTPKFCPRCGSPNVKLSSKLDIWLTPEQYICLDCGYKGLIIMELENEKTGKSEKTKQHKNERG